MSLSRISSRRKWIARAAHSASMLRASKWTRPTRCSQTARPAKVKAVWTAKQKLDREEAALKDCLADLEHAAVNKESLKDIVSDFSKKMQLLHDFLISIRKAYAKVTKLEPSDESGCKKALDEFVDFGNLMLVHQEGVKTMKASMKALT